MALTEQALTQRSLWKERAPYRQRLSPEGLLGQLQRETDMTVLRTLFQAGIRLQFSPQEQSLLLATYDFTMHIHAGQPKRRTGADARTHLARVAIIGLSDRGNTLQSTAVRLLHDSIEDNVATRTSLAHNLQELGWQEKDADAIADGAQVMSIYLNSKHLSPTTYDHRIIAMNKERKNLKLIEVKRDDRADNTRDDCVRLMDTIINETSRRAIETYLQKKAKRADDLPKPFLWYITPSHRRLRDARKLCAEELQRTAPQQIVNSRVRG